MVFTCLNLSLASNLLKSFCVNRALEKRVKPDSHRKIAKDYRPKTGKDQEILSESGGNLLQIVVKLHFSNDF